MSFAVISFPIVSSGDLTAENAEGAEREERKMNNSDATRFDISEAWARGWHFQISFLKRPKTMGINCIFWAASKSTPQ